MALRHSYTRLAPVYDAIVGPALDSARQNSLQQLCKNNHNSILINGIGSGLDIPYLAEAHYTGCDITPAMLQRAKTKADKQNLAIDLICSDSQLLPFKDNSFDAIVTHLILAIVPNLNTHLTKRVVF